MNWVLPVYPNSAEPFSARPEAERYHLKLERLPVPPPSHGVHWRKKAHPPRSRNRHRNGWILGTDRTLVERYTRLLGSVRPAAGIPLETGWDRRSLGCPNLGSGGRSDG